MKERGVELVLLRESIDTRTATGQLFFNMMLIFFKWEKSLIAERMSAGRHEKVLQGGWPWGSLTQPFGYKWDNGRFIQQPQEAKAIKLIFREVLNGRSLNDIARKLRTGGHPTKMGGPWGRREVEGMVNNPINSRPR